MSAVNEHGPRLGIAPMCNAVDLARATYYRSRGPKAAVARKSPPRALNPEERTYVTDLMHEPRFADLAPGEIYATLLDDGTYVCSERTMYRILAANQEVRERRDQRRHPAYAAPELLAQKPNQLWSWDITKLMGPAKWTYFYLYVILDVFSRKVVGWMVADRESAVLAERLIEETFTREGIERGQLTIHADRGSSMRSKAVALLLADLGVTKTHSRPHVSNDNPFSEAQFKTLKYRPDFPERFGSLEDARAFCVDFFDWYNREHHHAGIGLLTPDDLHSGRADERFSARAAILAAAFAMHPERFVGGRPTPPAIPTEVWINKPSTLPSRSSDARAEPASPCGLPRPSSPTSVAETATEVGLDETARRTTPASVAGASPCHAAMPFRSSEAQTAAQEAQ